MPCYLPRHRKQSRSVDHFRHPDPGSASVAVLAPPVIRSRREHRRSDSIGDFNYQLGVLGKADASAHATRGVGSADLRCASPHRACVHTANPAPTRRFCGSRAEGAGSDDAGAASPPRRAPHARCRRDRHVPARASSRARCCSGRYNSSLTRSSSRTSCCSCRCNAGSPNGRQKCVTCRTPLHRNSSACAAPRRHRGPVGSRSDEIASAGHAASGDPRREARHA